MNFKAIQTVGFWQDFTYYEEEKNRTEPKDVLKHGKKTIQMFAFFCFGRGWD